MSSLVRDTSYCNLYPEQVKTKLQITCNGYLHIIHKKHKNKKMQSQNKTYSLYLEMLLKPLTNTCIRTCKIESFVTDNNK